MHNQKVLMGICILPFVALFFNELSFFHWMPTNVFQLYTWQVWGCLATAGALPFVKNVVANRMIRHTGQAPWRFLEIVSMFLLFIFGGIFYDNISLLGTIAFFLVFGGRILGMLDALSKDNQDRRRAVQIQEAPQHSSSNPQYNYDPTGVADSFDREEFDTSAGRTNGAPEPLTDQYPSVKSQRGGTIESLNTNPLLIS